MGEKGCTSLFNKKNEQKSRIMNNNLILWEVFIQSKVNLPYKHVGNVHASDSEMALQNARDLYTRRNEGTSIGCRIKKHNCLKP